MKDAARAGKLEQYHGIVARSNGRDKPLKCITGHFKQAHAPQITALEGLRLLLQLRNLFFGVSSEALLWQGNSAMWKFEEGAPC